METKPATPRKQIYLKFLLLAGLLICYFIYLS